MAASYNNMTLRERMTEAERKQRRSSRNEEKSQDGFDVAEQDATKKPKKVDGRGAKYDSQGIHKETQLDACDCMNENCPGCFWPCSKCLSSKCGHECRRNRRWVYDKMEIEGTSFVKKNPLKK